MARVTITCPKCGENIVVDYAAWRGHYQTDEALAIHRAIEKHLCLSRANQSSKEVSK